ncbi:PQQ-dependent sugar dehydrogenase [Pelagicoccus sp. SDUM812003]|uniref:PQQ-dependent sugar dehydrogenase n=1 Tax=Pelagicoccus sp. SDUM812003 TaxID=3041267 RepID=UPI00280FD378|nr:PQQ-dependent sugar dehydrogenase [Pelagicoccus sp. SDUM812003]MDQ8203588.1 PQQ-dependent sugar dehydrogenase [Pelagicoccus sp. SDUM812003]
MTLLCALVLGIMSYQVQDAESAPPGDFAVEVVLSDLEQPMSMRFLPDGRLLLLLKRGEILIADVTGEGPATFATYMDLSDPSHAAGLVSTQERGVIDIALDPNFPTDPYIYIFYTPASGPNGPRSRVSRFAHVENSGGLTSRGNPASELMLWQDTHGYDSCCHFGGGLDFGPDGNLWLSTGDHFQGSYAESLEAGGGKIHRFGKDGSIPEDNPFVDGPGGAVDTIVAYGLRNPFRSRWDLETNRYYIGEVGGNTQTTAWEDLHVIQWDPESNQIVDDDYGTAEDNFVFDGINFGWPTVEGLPPHNDWPGANIDRIAGEPIFAWRHAGQTSAINGGVVYRGSNFPEKYVGAYFYADSTRDFVRYLLFNEDGSISPNPDPAPIDGQNPDTISYPFDLSPVGRIVSLEVGPDGALYYVSFTDSGGAYGEANPSVLGSLRRYIYDGVDPRPVIDLFEADYDEGSSPLDVTFQVQSHDPEGEGISYRIDFGDGTSTQFAALQNNNLITINHTYEDDGVYTATLYVTDGGLTESRLKKVTVGNAPVIQSISATNNREGADDSMFQFGDVFTFSAEAIDVEDGVMGPEAFVWEITFVRPGNLHPTQGPDEGVSSIDFSIPSQGQGFSGPVYYEARVTVTDSSGLSTQATIDVYPEKANIIVDSSPSKTVVQINGNTAVETLHILDTLVNWDHIISVPDTRCINGIEYAFSNWSDGSTDNPLHIIMPDEDLHLTAFYVPVGDCLGVPEEGLKLHLASDKGVTLDGDAVDTWLDQSENINLFQAQGQPTFVSGGVNGENYIHFDGVDDVLATEGLIGLPMGAEDRTMIMVARYNGTAPGGGWAGAAYGSPKLNSVFGTTLSADGSLGVQGWGSANDVLTDPPVNGVGSWKVHTATYSNGVLTQYVDGEPAGTANHVFATAGGKMRIGEEIDGNKNLDMDVAEIIVYNRALDPVEQTQAEDYYKERYLGIASNQAPVVGITSPLNETSYEEGSLITFEGAANDLEDGDLAEEIVWSSDLDGALGRGATIAVDSLRYGTHEITASVSDSGGNLGEESITVYVIPNFGVLPLEGLVVQLESDQNVGMLSPDDATVATWLDQSGLGNDLDATGNPQFISSATPAGLPAIAFDGVGDSLERVNATDPLGGLPLGNNDRTVYTVVKYKSGTGSGGVTYGRGRSNEAFGVGVSAYDGNLFVQGWGNVHDFPSNEPGFGAGWLIQGAVLEAGVATHYVDGAEVGAFVHNYNTRSGKLIIGEEIAEYGYIEMETAAVLIYNRALSELERAELESYLFKKYFEEAGSNSEPTVQITSPTEGQRFLDTDTITLTATATDAEDGDLSSEIIWVSSIDGELASGASAEVALSLGAHEITAATADSGGLAGDAKVSVLVTSESVQNLVLEGLALRLESDLGVETDVDETIISWSDQTARGNDVFGRGGPTLQLDATPSGMPSIELDGVGQKLERINSANTISGLPVGSANRTIFLVGRYDGGSAWGGASYGTGKSNQAFGLGTKQGTGELFLQGWGTKNDLLSTTPAYGAGWLIHSAIVDSGNAAHYLNGEMLGQFQHNYATVLSELTIGEEIAGYGYIDMGVAALLIYNRALSEEERLAVEDYLFVKYLDPYRGGEPSQVTIEQPSDGANFDAGEAVTFVGTASDIDQSDLSESIVWSSDLDGELGSGASIEVASLSQGQHVITASVIDSSELEASDTIAIEVLPGVSPSEPLSLFNQQDLSGFDLVYSESITPDPSTLFEVVDGQLAVSGDGFGGLVTQGAYRDYVAVLEFKWGENTFGNKVGKARHAGLVLHSVAPDPESPNPLQVGTMIQILEGSLGDIFSMAGTGVSPSLAAFVSQVACIENNWNCYDGIVWDSNGALQTFADGKDVIHWSGWDPNWQDVTGYRGQNDVERPEGDWNQMVVVADGDLLQIFVNGIKVNEAMSVDPMFGKLQLAVIRAEYHVKRFDLLPLGGAPGPLITQSEIPSGQVSLPYAHALNAVDLASLSGWSVVAGSLPDGIDLDTTTGELSGTPTSAGSFSFTVEVVDENGATDRADYTLVVDELDSSLLTDGLVLRLEADASVQYSGGAKVSAWTDQSGNGNDLYGYGDPTILFGATPSNRAAVSFDGAGDKLERSLADGAIQGLPVGNADRTVFMLARYRGGSAWAGFAYGEGSPNKAFGLLAKQKTGELVLTGWGLENDLISSSVGYGNAWLIHTGMVDSGIATHYRDGAQIGQFAHVYDTGVGEIVIGEEIANYGFVDMDVAALLVYDRALSLSERVQVESYLQETYLSSQPGNTAPTLDISSPADGSSVDEDVQINFAATASDLEDGDLSASIEWVSDLDGPIGTGASIATSLSVGQHVVSATVSDSGGLPAFDAVGVQVNAVIEGNLITEGLVLRLEADDSIVTSFADNVAVWQDQSGQGNHLTAYGAPQILVDATPAGGVAISLDGEGDKLERLVSESITGLPAGASDRSMFLVARYRPGSAWAGATYGQGSGNHSFGLITKLPAGELVLQGWGTPNDLISKTRVFGAGWLVHAGIVDSNVGSHFKDGQLLGQWNHTYDTIIEEIVIGEEIAGFGFADMDVAALLVYDRALSEVERQEVELYLSNKYMTASTSNESPQLLVTSPLDGNSYPTTQPLTLSVVSSDAEDGDLSALTVWYSDVDGFLGVGASIESTLSAGSHVIYATVMDALGVPVWDTVSITVEEPDETPTVTITSPTTGAQFFDTDTVTISGTASDPEDGDLTSSIVWTSSIDGALGSGASVDVGLSIGSHLIEATVTDGAGSEASDTITIEIVDEPNSAPTVSIASPANGASFSEGDQVTLSATASDAEDGNLSSAVTWASDRDGALGVGATLSVSSLSVGTHVISASVKDSESVEASDSVTVSVAELVNEPPVLTIQSPASGSAVAAGQSMTFTATAQDPEDGNIAGAIVWSSSKDGAFGTGASVSVSLSAGTHTITASVTDSGGEYDDASLSFTVVSGGSLVSSGLVLRLETDMSPSTISIASGTTISGWADSSGMGNNLVASGNPTVALSLTPSGSPALQLDGVGDKLSRVGGVTGLPAGNANRTVIVLARYRDADTTAGVAYGFGAENQTYGLAVDPRNGALTVQGWGGANDSVSGTNVFNTGWLVHSGVHESGTTKHYKDGVVIDTFDHSFATVVNRIVIGAEIADNGYVDMDIAAVLIYNRALSQAERIQVEMYLSGKYF